MFSDEFDKDIKELLEGDLYLFSKYALEYNQDSYLDLNFHYPMSLFLSLDSFNRKQLEAPRSFLKTTLGVEDYSTWRAVKNPDYERILIRCYVIPNAMKSIRKIRSHFENCEMVQRIWPETIPDCFQQTRWSDTCASIKRGIEWPEGTFTAAGLGTTLARQHFTRYIEDDLLVPKKDDLTGDEMVPSRNDVEKAIGKHKLANQLLVDPSDEILNVQNRWSEWDLIRYIIDYEPFFLRYNVASVKKPNNWPDSEATYPFRFSIDVLKEVEKRSGSYVFSTQYLGKPYDVLRMAFKLEWIKIYQRAPEGLNIYIVTDASLGETKYADYSVAMVIGISAERNIYVLDYIRGHLDPTDFINHIRALNYSYNPICVGVEKFTLDKTIGHFLSQYPEIRVEPVKRNKGESKDYHIRALIPTCRDGRFFIRDDMHELRNEFVEYPGKHDDLLDAAADIFRIANYPNKEVEKKEPGMFSLESILEEIRNKKSGNLPFDYQLREDVNDEILEEVF